MIAYLTKSDASEGFDQIINFLNGSSITYALTVNPNIYVSCIKQSWTSVLVKKVNDVTRLQALVDKKRVIITEATIRDALKLADAEVIDCLPNEEIFTKLSRMGVNTPRCDEDRLELMELTVFLLPDASEGFDQIINFLNGSSITYALTVNPNIYVSCIKQSWTSVLVKKVNDVTRLQALVDKKRVIITEATIRDALKLADAEVIDCLPNEEIFTKLSRMGMIVAPSAAGVVDEGAANVNVDVVPAAVDEPSIPSPTPPTQPPPPSQDQPFTLQDVANIAKEVAADAEIEESVKVEPVELQEVVKVVTTAKLITEVVTAASATITAAALILATAAAPTLTTAPSAARRRKRVVIRDPEETATPSTIIHSEAKSKDKGKGILVEEPKPLKKKEKEDNVVIRYQALKRNPQTEAQARKNMMIYLRNVAGFKMDYFKGMNYDHIRLIFEKKFNYSVAFLQKIKEQMEEEDSRVLKRLSESQEDKATKKHKLDEEVKDLRKHLQIVPNDDDDVYTKATPLALKVPIVDYKIYTENNKPYYKIKRADGTHQLYLSFLSMLRNFDREDLEVLWQLVKERFASSKPKNFSDDFLLTTLGAMFEKPDIQAQIWRNQRSVYGLA
nr:hypothetical protein [Tanacetum cinerariifolium]